jgi:hypothetical protein
MLRRLLTLLGLFIIILTVTLFGTAPAGAAQPPEPTYGLALVDGDPGEWTVTDPAVDPHSDHFAPLYRAAKPDNDILADLYLRYDCASGRLWALMLTRPTITIDTSNPEAYVKLTGIVRVSDASGNDGTPPDFQFIMAADMVVGWEAVMLVSPGSYTDLNVHTNILQNGSQTAQVANRAIPLLLDCSSCSARAIQGIVFFDENQNGLFDPFPLGFDDLMADVEVCLADGGTALTPVCTQTDGVGYYLFPNLLPATYTVAQTAVDGYDLMTTPYTVLLYGACDPAMDCDFANQLAKPPTSILLNTVGTPVSALPISIGALLLTLLLLSSHWLRRRYHRR